MGLRQQYHTFWHSYTFWHALHGISVIPLERGEKHKYQLISQTKTFTPPMSDRGMILAPLSKNTETQ
jgi:hypothetical protein